MTTVNARTSDTTRLDARESHHLHLELASEGQVAALTGRHDRALEKYREAIRLAVSINAPEVFFRFYTQCVLESLEHIGSYGEIIQFCLDADSYYGDLETPMPIHSHDHGAILERLGMAYLKGGYTAQAHDALNRAAAVAAPTKLPLTTEVLGWLNRRYEVSVQRLTELQHRHCYFVVRQENDPATQQHRIQDKRQRSTARKQT